MTKKQHEYQWDKGVGIGWTTIWSQPGRTRVATACPFCDVTVYGYIWSIAGHGKKCSCGALLGLYRAVPPLKESSSA